MMMLAGARSTCLTLGLASMVSLSALAEESASFEDSGLMFDAGAQFGEAFGVDSVASEAQAEEQPGWVDSWLLEPSRFSIGTRYGYKFAEPKRPYMNRSDARIEYNRFFAEHYYLILDVKTSKYWANDHRQVVTSAPETRVNKAYLQASFGESSVSVGVQTVNWGESQLAVITDVISPRDSREFGNIELDETRLGQPLVQFNQYSDVGRFSLIFVPDPEMNRTPERGTAYYPYGNAVIRKQDDKSGSDLFEYGLRWGKTFGNSDVSLMAASVIDNDYAINYAINVNTGNGFLEFTRERIGLYGLTANLVNGRFLWKTELGYKTDKPFNTTLTRLVHKDLFDAYAGVEYNYDTSTTISLEAANQHIVDWEKGIAPDRDRQQFMMSVSWELMNDDLTINLVDIYSRPNPYHLALLTTDYQWNDNFSSSLDITWPVTENPESDVWMFRDQRQIAAGIMYQF